MLFHNDIKSTAERIHHLFSHLLVLSGRVSHQLGVYLILRDRHPEENPLPGTERGILDEIWNKEVKILELTTKLESELHRLVEQEPKRIYWPSSRYFERLEALISVGEDFNLCSEIHNESVLALRPFEQSVIDFIQSHETEANAIISKINDKKRQK